MTVTVRQKARLTDGAQWNSGPDRELKLELLLRVKLRSLSAQLGSPLYPRERTSSGQPGGSFRANGGRRRPGLSCDQYYL